MARLRVRGRDLLGSGRIVVVFDGEGGPGLSTGGSVPVELVYAHSESADDASCDSGEEHGLGHGRLGGPGAGERAKAQAGTRAQLRDPRCCFESAGKGCAEEQGTGQHRARVRHAERGNAITRELKELWLDGDE